MEVLQLIAAGDFKSGDCQQAGDHSQCGQKAYRQYLWQVRRQKPHPGDRARPPA